MTFLVPTYDSIFFQSLSNLEFQKNNVYFCQNIVDNSKNIPHREDQTNARRSKLYKRKLKRTVVVHEQILDVHQASMTLFVLLLYMVSLIEHQDHT